MSFKLKGLREQRAAVATKIKALGSVLHKEERAMTPEEKTSFDQLKTDWTTLGTQIQQVTADIQALDALVNATALDPNAPAEPPPADAPAPEGTPDVPQGNSRKPGTHDRNHRPDRPRGGDGADLAQTVRDRKMAFQAWARARYGLDVTEQHRDAAKRVGVNLRSKTFEVRIGGAGSVLRSGLRRRGLSTAAGSGGYTIAEGFSGVLESALLDHSNVRGVCDEFTTDTGADLPYPTEDDTSNTGEIIGESAETNFADNSFGSVIYRAFKFSSKGVLITYELLNDSEFDLESFIAQQLGIRLGRIQGARFTTGTGTGQPQGIVTASTLGITTASGTAFTADELTRLAFSVDRAYRLGPKVGYMMHDTAMAYALLLKDLEGRPLLRESYRDGIAEPTINGYPVHVNQYMDACTGSGGVPVTAKKHVLFGDYSKHKVRDVGTVRIRRLDERYAEKDQIGFVGFQRSDSRCVNSAAIKHLQQA